MARIYKAITSATTTTLIAKGHRVDGGISKMTICNNSANAATGISVHVWSGVGGEPVHPFVHNVTIPSGATLVLDDNLSFDGSKFNLRISNAGTDPDITVIIK
tara:strand:+ start:2274 stop:2582 length:309 start_codon:yes stop_codon:yes gene_type:complete